MSAADEVPALAPTVGMVTVPEGQAMRETCREA